MDENRKKEVNLIKIIFLIAIVDFFRKNQIKHKKILKAFSSTYVHITPTVLHSSWKLHYHKNEFGPQGIFPFHTIIKKFTSWFFSLLFWFFFSTQRGCKFLLMPLYTFGKWMIIFYRGKIKGKICVNFIFHFFFPINSIYWTIM